MIKILKPGRKPAVEEFVYTTTCPNCECEFEFQDEDCIWNERCLNGLSGIICPCCGNSLSIRRSGLPCRVKN